MIVCQSLINGWRAQVGTTQLGTHATMAAAMMVCESYMAGMDAERARK